MYLSVASVWEAGIKHRLGKLPMPGSPASYHPGKQKAHVGQAFQPDLSVLSGWKA